MKLFKLPVVLGAILFCSSQLLWAEEPQSAPQTGVNAGSEQQTGEHRGPPPEAYTACEGKTAGTAASFTNHKGELINGACQADHEGKLVVRREHPQN